MLVDTNSAYLLISNNPHTLQLSSNNILKIINSYNTSSFTIHKASTNQHCL